MTITTAATQIPKREGEEKKKKKKEFARKRQARFKAGRCMPLGRDPSVFDTVYAEKAQSHRKTALRGKKNIAKPVKSHMIGRKKKKKSQQHA